VKLFVAEMVDIMNEPTLSVGRKIEDSGKSGDGERLIEMVLGFR
jgi:hypothetical protein